ncbi:DNA helicase [Staphylococcus phage Alsa_4]|nr:DNA helicase [Staphylococcus phage Alsa_4]
MLTFITEQRVNQKNEILKSTTKIKSSYNNKITGTRKILTQYRDSLDIPKKEFKKYISRDCITIDRLKEVLELYPQGDSEIKKMIENVVDSNIYYQEVTDIQDNGDIETFDVCMPETHSFIAQTVVNHNTEIASGIIQQIKPYLESDERVAFFTDKKEIFNQSAERISQRLGVPVGKLGGGQKDIKQVTVVMIPTINSGLKDPEKGVKLTPKERLYKKIAKEILPMFEKRSNHRDLLAMYVRNFKPKTKVDQTLLQELENVYNTCGTDSAVLMKLRNYNAKYIDTIKKKNKKTYEKYNELKEFLESVAVMICDETHHTGSDTWYNSLRNCTNARYRVGLTGSIDKKNEVLWRRLQSLFGDIVSKIENDFLISKGYSAKPVIKMFPITSPSNIDKVSDYQPAYQQGITNNEFRNTLIAKLTKMCYNENKGILIIVNYLEHGQNISEILTRLDVDHYFVHGQLDDDTRKSKLADMKAGKLKVMIATSIIDEGVDISGINALVIAAGGKSLRQTLQRIGRALRKKDKDNTTQIFDFVDYTNKHLLKHSKERRKIYDEEKFEVVDIRPNK